MSVEAVKKQAKNIEVLPSQMHIEGYVRVKFRCVCCKRKFAPDGELRKEDVDEILTKNFQPICRNCAKQTKKHVAKYGELEGRLSAIQKLFGEFLFEVQSAIELMTEDYQELGKQYYEKNRDRLNEAYLHYKKDFEGLVGLLSLPLRNQKSKALVGEEQ